MPSRAPVGARPRSLPAAAQTSRVALDVVTGAQVKPRGENAAYLDASGGAYLHALPDTRRTHDDKLIKGENFTDEPGRMAVLTYTGRASPASALAIAVMNNSRVLPPNAGPAATR